MLKKDKRGIGNSLFALLIIAGVLIVIMLVVFVFQMAGPPLISTTNSAKTILHNSIQTSGNPALVNASANSIEPGLESLNNMEWIAYTLFTLMFLSFLGMCLYVRTYPFLLVFWIVLIILLTIVSLYLAVSYQGLRTDTSLGYQSWENTDFMLKNLPTIIFTLGAIGGIVMFGISRGQNEQEQLGYYGGQI